MNAIWYFDFVSPFSYLQLVELDRRGAEAGRDFEARPILFAALLSHFGHKGPAEIPQKRIQTYRFCQWFADRRGIPFRFPPAHPFNPLDLLRLAISLDSDAGAIREIFDTIFGRGEDLGNPAVWAAMMTRLGVSDAEARIADVANKARLRENTDLAIERGVYGVPTIDVGGELFWGVDSTELALDFVARPRRYLTGEYDRLAHLATAATRKT